MLGKKELIEIIAEGSDITKKEATEQYENVFGALNAVLCEGQEVAIPDVGRFKITDRPARTARNPRTNEIVNVPAKKAPKFQFAKCVKEAVAQL